MLKKLIKKHIENTIPKNEKVAVMFSGGLDSLSVLLSALELGYEVKLYTFHLKGVISKDLETARKVSKHYKLELHEVEISDNLDLLIDDLKYLIKTHDLKKKTQFQVMHPMKHLCEAIKEDYVLKDVSFKANIKQNIPIGNIANEGTISKEITNMKNIVFKRQ